jgi:hypothetical protein
MTPKDKAEELVNKFDDTMEFSTPQRFAKQCALIAVDEVLKYSKAHGFIGLTEEYEQIKKEIKKL